ncbi:signal peptidase I [Bellilinea sp.]|uniref:Signal peptidase I n=1 Tax=Bellilinea caldifistulae TaxID=360411 RepID=A0A7C4Q2Z4_9CHLR|nr:signal peptidase I [Bellilinea sp.]
MSEERSSSGEFLTATEAASQTAQPANTLLGILSEVFKTILFAVLLYFAISAVTDRVRVENISMQPTLNEGELLVVYKLAYRLGEPHRGDIIVFHHNRQPPEDYIKRVIGLPGDQVRVEGGRVYVNGIALDEPYIAEPPAYTGVWEVPPDSLFVLGDNRNRSSDSRIWGFVPMRDVVGRAVLIYWPPEKIRLLSHADLLAQAAP